jgi:hypothetical protein
LFLPQRFYHETMLGASEIAPGVEQEECKSLNPRLLQSHLTINKK